MILFQPKLFVTKAKRRPWKRTRTYARQTALANTMAKSVQVDLKNGLKKFKSRIQPERIYEAWLSGNWQKTLEFIPWESLPTDLSPVGQRLQRGIEDSAAFSRTALPEPVNEALRFDTRNPAIRDYMLQRSANLVVDIEADTKSFIQNAVARSFDEALTPRRVADIIKPSIGLYPGQVRALMNYQLGLEQQNVPREQVMEKVDEYHDRLLDYRAKMIARTETRFATNAGQQAVWEAASNQGLIDSESTMRRWIVDGAPCEICEPMEGVEVGLNEPWVITYPDGGQEEVDIPTDSHPNCMCGMELVFKQAEGLE